MICLIAYDYYIFNVYILYFLILHEITFTNVENTCQTIVIYSLLRNFSIFYNDNSWFIAEKKFLAISGLAVLAHRSLTVTLAD
jgi:hypothetical protein